MSAAPVWIRVTPADLASGRRHHCSECPLALAIKRAFPGRSVTVSDRPVTIAVGLRVAILHPTDLRLVGEFVEAFDAGRDVDCIEFELSLGDPDSLAA
jgi:hypothetical protein